jgi:replication-associated recombination protein RarA
VAAPAGTETAHRQEPPSAPSSGGELVGREGLIGEVTGVLDAARRSEGGAVVLRGQAGIGKSSLLAVARSAGAAAGMRVLAANGARNESGLPFAGLTS